MHQHTATTHQCCLNIPYHRREGQDSRKFDELRRKFLFRHLSKGRSSGRNFGDWMVLLRMLLGVEELVDITRDETGEARLDLQTLLHDGREDREELC